MANVPLVALQGGRTSGQASDFYAPMRSQVDIMQGLVNLRQANAKFSAQQELSNVIRNAKDPTDAANGIAMSPALAYFPELGPQYAQMNNEMVHTAGQRDEQYDTAMARIAKLSSNLYALPDGDVDAYNAMSGNILQRALAGVNDPLVRQRVAGAYGDYMQGITQGVMRPDGTLDSGKLKNNISAAIFPYMTPEQMQALRGYQTYQPTGTRFIPGIGQDAGQPGGAASGLQPTIGQESVPPSSGALAPPAAVASAPPAAAPQPAAPAAPTQQDYEPGAVTATPLPPPSGAATGPTAAPGATTAAAPAPGGGEFPEANAAAAAGAGGGFPEAGVRGPGAPATAPAAPAAQAPAAATATPRPPGTSLRDSYDGKPLWTPADMQGGQMGQTDNAGNPIGPSADLWKEFQGEERKNYESAVGGMAGIHEVELDINQLARQGHGILTPGAFGEVRAQLSSAINTAYTMLGEKPPIDPNNIASAEDWYKVTRRMAFGLQTQFFGHQRAAASTIAQDIAAVPGFNNQPLGGALMLESIKAQTTRALEERNFKQQWASTHNMSLVGASEAFAASHPAEGYVEKAFQKFGMGADGRFASPEAAGELYNRGLIDEGKYRQVLHSQFNIN